ncbi:hypothetical protein Ddye_015289 [Dipteronia dyeriana]|uniref:DM2 domain-containing protein n=1 Tax=Dipteronia dyeriana TaxID=168575 RepID=A0AAD9U5F3_9ROSI|nr:hypothetical protein Ddye_015289 [Dipteronia dyeriana]
MAGAYNRLFGGCRALMAAAKTESGGVRSSGIRKVVPVSPQLAKFLGSNEASRTDAVKLVWEYIKHNSLQNPQNKKEIRCDDKLKTIFGEKDTVGFTEITRLLSQHFVKSA